MKKAKKKVKTMKAWAIIRNNRIFDCWRGYLPLPIYRTKHTAQDEAIDIPQEKLVKVEVSWEVEEE